MSEETLKQANAIQNEIDKQQKELKTFKDSMNFGGQLPERIRISNADAPYLPLVIENSVVAMVILDTILEQFNDKITKLRAELQSL